MVRSIVTLSLLLVACAESHEDLRSTGAREAQGQQLDQSAIDVAMERVRPVASSCVQLGRNQQTWNVRLTIRGDGHPTDVTVENAQDDPAIAACLEGALSAALFPQFTGPPVTITVPYYVH